MKQLYLLFFLFVLAVLPVTSVQAQTKGSIADVRFIEGSWKAVSGDRSIDAVWSMPVGENIVGYVRVMKDGTVVLYELFAFEQTQQGLAAMVRHFNPGLIAREEKDRPDRYNFLEAGKDWALFKKEGDNVRVRYEKRSDDEFAIVIGRLKEREWVFQDFWKFSRMK